MHTPTIQSMPRSALWIALGSAIYDSTWATYRRTLGEDDFLCQLRDFRYALTRAHTYYSEPKYWRSGSYMEQCFAESQAEHYRDLAQITHAFEYLWLTEAKRDAIAADLAKLETVDPSVVWLTRQEESAALPIRSLVKESGLEIPGEIERAMLHIGKGAQLCGVDSGAAQMYEHWVVNPAGAKEPEKLRARAGDTLNDSQQETRELMADYNSLAIQCYAMAAELADFSRMFNELSGVHGKTSTLLTNFNIPVPTQHTILGWWAYMGIACRPLDIIESAKAARYCGFTPDYIMTYTTPMMPRTKEHVNHGSIQSDDSHADHSLSSRSKAHRRTASGAIDYGLARVRTILLDSRDRYIIAEEADLHNITSLRTFAMHESHIRMAAHIRSSLYTIDPFFNLTNKLLRNPDSISGVVRDPFATFADTLPFFWASLPKYRLTADTGSRSLAKYGKLHFAFHNEDAIQAWCEAFESSIRALLYADRQEFTRIIMRTVRQVDAFDPNPASAGVEITKGGNSMTFRFE